ncbi:MAG TPA: hypothetical protein VHG28_19630 [Longimicrobiaceae bacterium]|nr:hypothetical protein [Longimicrobiaceae bacterium]
MILCTAALCLTLSLPLPQQGRKPDRWFGEDKWKHFFASFVATSLSATAARAGGLGPRESAYVGAGVGGAVGVWKELRDRGSPETGTASFRDLVWDAAGVGAGTLVALQAR